MKIIIGLSIILFYGCLSSVEPKIIESSYGMGFYLSQKQSDSLTCLQKFHSDCFISNGYLKELLWMAKGGLGHAPFQIIVTSGSIKIWESPIYTTGYIECVREDINKYFDKEINIYIKHTDTKNPIEIYITTIIKE